MAGSTIGSVFSIMFIFVTCHTLTGRSLIHAIPMALGAFKVGMFSHEWETCIVMIEGCIAPPAGGMTGTTVRTELPIMGILRSMTGITIRGRALVNAVRMAGITLNIRVFPGKREGGGAVIEGHIAPSAGIVAGSAIRPKLTVVFILRCVT